MFCGLCFVVYGLFTPDSEIYNSRYLLCILSLDLSLHLVRCVGAKPVSCHPELTDTFKGLRMTGEFILHIKGIADDPEGPHTSNLQSRVLQICVFWSKPGYGPNARWESRGVYAGCFRILNHYL